MTGTFPLTSDHFFDFEILRILSMARYGGADVGEVLKVGTLLKPGDFESYHDAFNNLAVRINKQADAINVEKSPVSARDAYFRASSYFRAAEFFLHGKPDDPRIHSLWNQQTKCFDKAIALLPQPGQRLTLKGDGFNIPIIFYPAAKGGSAKPKPTIIVGSGFDGSQEALLHSSGFAALERGYNFVTYEGPGQPTVRLQQGLGFIHDWEKVVTPVVDYLVERSDVDPKRIALSGWSLGGYLCVRAAAFEPRIAATVAIDGVEDASVAFSGLLPPDAKVAYETGDADKLNVAMDAFLASGKAPTAARWVAEHGVYSFAGNTFADFMEGVTLMKLGDTLNKVKRPVLICEASEDLFFPGQPALVKKGLGDLGTHVILTDEDSASAHCHLGALTFANQIVFDWLDDILSR